MSSIHKMEVEDEGSRRALRFIRTTIDGILQKLYSQPPGELRITFRRITSLEPKHKARSREVEWVAKEHEVTYTFPGRTKEEAWRFACVLRILSEIYSAITSNIVVTKRDIFYRDPALFQKQEVVDRYIDDIAHTCNVRRLSLNVTASPKGLVAGLQMSEELYGPELIPASTLDRDVAHINWVLVVEKEATFNTLVEQQFHFNERLGRGILVTAKGYPDLATRRFLRSITDTNFGGPIFGLFDCDPYGIDILKCYLVGSKVSVSEDGTALAQLQWIGVKAEHIIDLESGCMNLSVSDRAKAKSILESMQLRHNIVPLLGSCAEQLQRMLMLNQKAEIQAVDGQGRHLSRWLEHQILSEEWC